ncbi:sodium-dependent phosphate transporter 1-A [Anopheles maculipalpis]|uniref:sodium-dependent phosphate transporter 1-A n=1 Tax=Anopheles maculipalpis TaxID=1496333 RepID=UPI0021597E33|nr:sodium-dependent phosphate transporter 1-A [Anopheles maculipalpis]
MEPFSPDILWLVIVGFVIAFILAFGIGANDVANSFGTSVGSGVLSIRQACWLATVCEVSGAVLIGYKVSDTMRKGILEVEMYRGEEIELMLGCLSALGSSALWLLVATFFKMPISGTHSIVGSTIGFSLVARGTQGLKWNTLLTIIGSWFISPVLSGLVSVMLFWLIRRFILHAKNPLEAGLFALPLFYGATLAVNVFSIVHDGPKLLYMDNIPLWVALVVSLTLGLIVLIMVRMVIVPWQRRKIINGLDGANKTEFTLGDSDGDSSSNGSPRRAKRPLSLVAGDGKALPAITETTELVSLSSQHQQQAPHNGLVKKLSNDLTAAGIGGPYSFNPEIVKKANSLLGAQDKTSLDNTDLTVTSLNYIDEFQSYHGNGRFHLGTYFDRRNSTNVSPKSPDSGHLSNGGLKEQPTVIALQNGKSPTSPKSDSTLPVTDYALMPQNVLLSSTDQDIKKTDMCKIEAAAGLEHPLISATLSPNSSKVPLIGAKEGSEEDNRRQKPAEENEDVSKLFSFLQVLTATFGSFAHGGNDVSNAIGPLIALFMIYREGSVLQQSETPLSILLYGGLGISVGLWLWGRRVIETIGNDLTKITPSTGFTIEIGAALTVLIASKIGLPISTTHCKVGSVVFVGQANSRPMSGESSKHPHHHAVTAQQKAVDWGLFRNIVYAWVVTVPVAALLSAGFMMILRAIVLP